MTDEEKPKAHGIQKVNYTHAAVIDYLIANPEQSQGDVSRHFGYTQGWLSRVMSSDAFREALAKRRSEIVDPIVAQSVQEKLTAVVSRAADVILDKLDATPDAGLAIKAIDVAARAAGFGAKSAQVQVNQQFVVQMPEKEKDAVKWAEKHSPTLIIEATP